MSNQAGIYEKEGDSMSIEAILSLLIAIAALLFTAFSFRRTQFQDNSSDATERANMTADIRYIRSSVDDIKLETKAVQRDIVDMREKLIQVEASSKSAHKRIDELVKRKDDAE